MGITGRFGPMHVDRDCYVDDQSGHCRDDAALAVETCYTTALSRLLCRSAAKNSYQDASEDLFEYAALKIGDRQIQRLVQQAPFVLIRLERRSLASLAF